MARRSAAPDVQVTMLDVGRQKYGDCLLLRFGRTAVLVDGAHPGDDASGPGEPPSIPDQLGALLGGDPPYRVALLIVTHAHLDHIGCLPAMVKGDLIRPDWALVADPDLGWGRADGGASPTDAPGRPEVARLAAAFREESRADERDDRVLSRFLVDAASLEDRYLAMLAGLERRGTRVVRYVGPDSPGLAALLAEFEPIGLEILGPSREHLEICGRAIAGRATDALAAASSARDSAPGVPALAELEAYRSGVAALDAADAGSGLNPAINNQSLVTLFSYRDKTLLLSGDLQLAEPQVPGLAAAMATLRAAIAAGAPYDFFKVGHHGSDNAFDEALLDELQGTPILGICTGSNSRDHPNREVLEVLERRGDEFHWARTDHNGRVTFAFGENLTWDLARGEINDPAPNPRDDAPPAEAPAVAAPRPEVPSGSGPVVLRAESSDRVEVHAWVPHKSTRVTLTIDVQPGGAGHPTVAEAASQAPDGTLPGQLPIAPGRDLPRLLFVTSREGLARNIGAAEADLVVRSLRSRGQAVLDGLPDGLRDVRAAAPVVGAELLRGAYEGVVLVGGYDVVPAQRVDVLTEAMRRDLSAGAFGPGDPDDFCVWSDGIYGDADGDGVSDLPVSRIPDGKDRDLVFAALAARLPGEPMRCGIRNVYRPFADAVFAGSGTPPLGGLPGSAAMLVSRPHEHAELPSNALVAGYVYLMLHGDPLDSSQFWGEGPGSFPSAFHVRNVLDLGRPFSGVVFSGCCWGALSVDEPARRVRAGDRLTPKTPAHSVALAFLKAGASAFVGCTGAHYSPINRTDLRKPPAVDHYGGPMHRAFWANLAAGSPPAVALRQAKISYLNGMPYLKDDPSDSPISRKILAQFVCLGLGW